MTQVNRDKESILGRCDCDQIQYAVNQSPLYVHCCHCTWCQRESGAAFAINALIESSAIEVTHGVPALIDTPSESRGGQLMARCPNCQVALWSHYPNFGKLMSFIKVGTLDNPHLMPPDIQIFTQSKQQWFILPTDKPASKRFYNRDEMWPKDSLLRLDALLKQLNQQNT